MKELIRRLDDNQVIIDRKVQFALTSRETKFDMLKLKASQRNESIDLVEKPPLKPTEVEQQQIATLLRDFRRYIRTFEASSTRTRNDVSVRAQAANKTKSTQVKMNGVQKK